MFSFGEWAARKLDVPEEERRPICQFSYSDVIICNNAYGDMCLNCNVSEKAYDDFLEYARERGFDCCKFHNRLYRR